MEELVEFKEKWQKTRKRVKGEKMLELIKINY